MLQLVKVLSTETGSLGRRIVKFLRFGLSDVQTSISAQPYGIDSNPVKDMIAVYGATSEKGKTVIIGYLNKDSLAEVGGNRLYSTDESGAVKALIYLRASGDAEINGSDDNMVRFSKLEEGFNKLKEDHNKLVTAFNSHVHATSALGPPVIPTPVPNSIPAIPTTATISAAKIENVKTNSGT